MLVKGKDVVGRVRQYFLSFIMGIVCYFGYGDYLVSLMRFVVWCKLCGCSDFLGVLLSKRELRYVGIFGFGQCSQSGLFCRWVVIGVYLINCWYIIC